MRLAAPGLAATLLILLPPAVPAVLAAVQQQDDPHEYEQALALLASGDTTTAIDLLRVVNRAEPRFGPAFLRLGAVLAARASEVEYDFGDRVEAERAFRRAMGLMGPDPELILEWGMLLRKQHIRFDALRTLETAVLQAERQQTEFSPALVAKMNYEMARIYEVWWEDGQDQHLPSAGAPRECWAASAPQAALCADVRGVHYYVADRGRMMAHYRTALKLDPTHVDAGIRLLGHLADQDDWEEYNALASRMVANSPLDPRVLHFRALGLHHVGRSDLAEPLFERALSLTPSEDRRAYEMIGDLLHPRSRRAYLARDEEGRRDVERLFFTATDPMYLTDVEERRLEHYARTAWVDLKFSSPTSGVRGWDTDRGLIYRRYGPPDGTRQARGPAGGIGVGWTYTIFQDLNLLPPINGFGFGRNETYRLAQFHPLSRLDAFDLEVLRAESYRPRTITEVADYPHQVARFRGTDPRLVRFEVFSSPPLRFLALDAGDTLTTGLFLHDPAFHPVWHYRSDIEVPGPGVGLSYRVEMPPGAYFYSLEARAAAPDSVPRPLARARRRFAGQQFPADRVSLSDVLLADAIEPTVTAVTSRDQLRIEPSYSTVLSPGAPLNIYFEVYGLAADQAGYGRFQVELLVADSAGPGVITRILRGVQGLVRTGPEQGTRQSWERTVSVPPGDDRIPEYLTLALPPLRSGTYQIQIEVTDLLNRTTATTVRYFIVDPAPRLQPAAQPGEIGLDVLLPEPTDTRSLLHWLITGERLPPTDTLPARDTTAHPAGERSMLHRLITGQRLPPPDTLQAQDTTTNPAGRVSLLRRLFFGQRLPPPDTLPPPAR